MFQQGGGLRRMLQLSYPEVHFTEWKGKQRPLV